MSNLIANSETNFYCSLEKYFQKNHGHPVIDVNKFERNKTAFSNMPM